MSPYNCIPCQQCSKTFRSQSGLSWHLFHIHGWTDAKQFVSAHPAKSVHNVIPEAMDEEEQLTRLAAGSGMDLKELKQIIGEYLARQALLRQAQ
jgi:hypothetical protein